MAWAAPGAMPISEKIDESDGSSKLVDERTPPAFVSQLRDGRCCPAAEAGFSQKSITANVKIPSRSFFVGAPE